MIKILSATILLFCGFINIYAQKQSPFRIDKDTLYVNDGASLQKFLMKAGNLYLIQSASVDKVYTQQYNSPQSDVFAKDTPVAFRHQLSQHPATLRSQAFSRFDFTVVYKEYESRRSLIVYENTPGVEWRFAVKGKNIFEYKGGHGSTGLIENIDLLNENLPYYFHLPATGSMWATETTLFKEATDHHTNLIQTRKELPYKKSQYYSGSVLQMQYPGFEHLIVKLSPLQYAQAAYYGYDFSTDLNGIKVHSPGIVADALHKNEWQEAYPVYVVMYAKNEDAALGFYKNYELSVNKYIPELDNTFTMNTWGDRNRDSRINEKFILNELDVAAKLGITHFQIDDGWQKGLSINSASKNKLLWDDWSDDDWNINRERFPNGFAAVLKKARSLNMNIGLWFNPSKQDNHAKWERDKNILVNLYKQYGVSWIKIDGLQLADKFAEKRVTAMLQQAKDETGGKLSFNMDVTAGQRGGYFFLNRVGNIFLENRYTDWGNYFPHLTLRNAWMLSKYTPLQRLQIEFLNKWRNEKRYTPSDPLRPANIPFDYIFATSMMAQPLAWMEATGLPKEAFDIKRTVDIWQQHRSEMQSGIIYPIGDMPNGRSFTGFVSDASDKVYVLLYREYTSGAEFTYQLPDNLTLKDNTKFIPLAGKGTLKNTKGNAFDISMPSAYDFLFGYFQK